MQALEIEKMNNDFRNIIEKYPLFKKYKSINKHISPYIFHKLAFSYNCKCVGKNKETTYELRIRDVNIIDLYRPKPEEPRATIVIDRPTKQAFKNIDYNKDIFPFDDLVIYEGICKLCNSNKIEYVLKFSSKMVEQNMEYTICKIGQSPAFQLVRNQETFNFLSDEDQDCYSKAALCLMNGYGIGAFAYFRRIIENEIKRIITTLIENRVDNFDKIKIAFDKYQSDHQMEKLIKETNDFIPESLKFNKENPLSILYKQLSGGIHEYNEDICLDKAEKIDLILSYTISQLNKEQNENKLIKEAFRSLLN